MLCITYSGVRRKKFRGVQGYGRPRRGSGGEPPRTPENFRKFAKIFLKKIAKMHYFSLSFKKNLTNHTLIFLAFGLKAQIVGQLWENCESFDENSIEILNFLLFKRLIFILVHRNFAGNIYWRSSHKYPRSEYFVQSNFCFGPLKFWAIIIYSQKS